jgi:hypothetical protein
MLPPIGEPPFEPAVRRAACLMSSMHWGAALLIAAAGSMPTAGAADTVEAVAPRGAGVLTKCRDWLVMSTCRTYRHITLPSRVAIGDTITLSFGSSPKKYGFYVVRIELERHYCTIFAEAEGDPTRSTRLRSPRVAARPEPRDKS